MCVFVLQDEKQTLKKSTAGCRSRSDQSLAPGDAHLDFSTLLAALLFFQYHYAEGSLDLVTDERLAGTA